MQYIVLAVILAVMQAFLPVPRQASDSSAGASKNVQNQPGSEQADPKHSPAPVNADQPQGHDANTDKKTKENGQQSVKITEPITVDVVRPQTTWTDRGVWFFNLCLAVTSALQVWLLCRTLAFIRRQTHEMKRQRITMREQLKAMQGQLVQAGKQAEAASDAAKAARDNIELVIGKERARVRVELQKFDLADAGKFIFHQVDCLVFSYGTNSAFVSDSRVWVGVSPDAEEGPPDSIPARQPISVPRVLHPTEDGVKKRAIILTQFTPSDVDAIRKGALFVHFRGVIEFSDWSERKYVTRFRYVWKPSFSAFFDSWGGYWSRTGKPEDNSET